MNDSSENQEVEDNQLEPQQAGGETAGDDELAEVVESDEKKINPLFSDEAEDDDYDYEDLDDEESRVVWYFAAFFIIVICTGVIILAASVAQDNEKVQIRIPEDMSPSMINGKRAPADTPMVLPGLISPVIHSVDKANLNDTERVIGVTVGDKHRAYLANAFDSLGSKVINDLIDNVPISVTYCDIHERARVFTSSSRGDFLNMGLGGWVDKEMFFYYDNEEFKHSAEDAPIPDYPYIVTTWGEWKDAHPQTEIYMGGGVIPKDNKALNK